VHNTSAHSKNFFRPVWPASFLSDDLKDFGFNKFRASWRNQQKGFHRRCKTEKQRLLGSAETDQQNTEASMALWLVAWQAVGVMFQVALPQQN
jgi:hypothetical protein